MVKTMNKDDVLYRAMVDQFDLGKVAEISGKPANSAIKAAIADAKKRKKAGELKKPEGKIGKIEGHLFLRLKDGDTHIDDFLILKNFDQGVPVAPDKGNAYRQLVAGYVQVRTTAFNKLKAGEKAVKLKHTQISEIADRVRDMLGEAQTAFGYNNPADKAAQKLKDAIDLYNQAEQLFNDECHQPFDEHRNYKAPQGVEEEDIKEYSRSYYLSEWRPVYGKAKEYLAMSKNLIAEIRTAAKNVRNFANNGEQKAANWVSMAEELAELCETEVDAATKVWGLQPYDGVAKAVSDDLEKLLGTRVSDKVSATDKPKIIERYLQTSSERMIALKNGFGRMQKHVTKMTELTGQVKTIPKEALKLPKVKEAVKRIEAAKKAQATYVKDVEKSFKEAGKAFAEVKKEAAVVG